MKGISIGAGPFTFGARMQVEVAPKSLHQIPLGIASRKNNSHALERGRAKPNPAGEWRRPVRKQSMNFHLQRPTVSFP